MTADNRVQWVYSSTTNEELEQRYDEWAGEYDADLEREFGWIAPQRTAELTKKYVSTEARVLDAGVGTGLVGQCLWDLGFRNMVAIDLSQGMLEEARKKGVYNELRQMILGEELDYPTGSMGAVVSSGVMTVGHAPASSLDELVRITEPGGYVVFTLRPDVYTESGFKEKQDSLVESGKWTLVEATEPFQALPKGEPDVYHQVWVYQVR